MATAPRALVWLRNDLRSHDNAALAAAAAAVARGEASSVVPFVPFDPRNHGRSTLCGFPKTGAFRSRFRIEAARDLRERLVALGSGLAVRLQSPEDAVVDLLRARTSPPSSEGGAQVAGGIVFVADEPFSEEREAVEAVRKTLSSLSRPADSSASAGASLPSSRRGEQRQLHELRVVEPRGGANSMIHPDDFDFGSENLERLPDLFTAFRNAVEGGDRWKLRAPLPAPAKGALPLPHDDVALASEMTTDPFPLRRVEDLNPLISRACEAQGVAAYELETPDAEAEKLGVMQFRGGETAAYARLNHYLFGSRAASTYFETRNGMLGADYSTKFSPWLAAGCLSARIVAEQLQKYERQHGANKSTYWIVFELLWRDFFQLYSRKHGSRIFAETGVSRKGGVSWRSGPAADAAFEAWIRGKTGRPLVDANMRELSSTGFMSNRGRQNVASYLVHDLGIDWRRGAEYFESVLLDSDTASNWGNWMMAAGFSGNRINFFNIAKQSADYDPRGEYVLHWLPELRGMRNTVEGKKIHDPRSMSSDEARAAGVVVGVDYPVPIATFPSPHTAADRAGGRGGRVGGGRGGGGGGGSRGGGRGGGGARGRERKIRDGGALPATDGGLRGRPLR